jgi:transposase
MPRKAPVIELSPEEEKSLVRLAKSATTPQGAAMRARIILLASEGKDNQMISSQLGVGKNVVTLWRSRFRWHRMESLRDTPGRGRKRKYVHEHRLQVIARSCEESELGRPRTIREIAGVLAALGVSKTTVGRMLKEIDLKPSKVESWLTSRDPDFERKAAEICGLYLNPPANALVVSIDEKTGIQALGRVVPDKPARPGSPRKQDFEYIRHGTASLFAAFLVHSGDVIAEVRDRHTRVEFIDFLEEVHRQCPKDKMIHVILDNLAVHKTQEVKGWLKGHARFEFHFTPTHASWLNQVEMWFSILARKFLKNGVFGSKQELVAGIVAYIRNYNETAKPFRWTYASDPLRIG